jgi:hypothetical protein
MQHTGEILACLGVCPQDEGSRSPSTQPGFKEFFGFDPAQDVGVRGCSFHELTAPTPVFASSPQPEFTASWGPSAQDPFLQNGKLTRGEWETKPIS